MDARTDQAMTHADEQVDEMTDEETAREETVPFVVPPPAVSGVYMTPPLMVNTPAAPMVADESGEQPPASNRSSGNESQAVSQIEETRAELGDTIGAIWEKLNPTRLATQVRESIRDTVVERAGHRIDTAKDMVKEVAQRTIDTATHLLNRPVVAPDTETIVEPAAGTAGVMVVAMKGFGAGMFNVVRQNPFPITLIGISALWLAASARRSSSSQSRDGCGPYSGSPGGSGVQSTEVNGGNVRDMADTVTQGIGDFGAKAQEQVIKVKGGLARTMDERPLVAGAVALVFGMAAGFIVPETSKENEVMGDTRDRFASQAERTVKQTISTKVDEVAHGLAERVEKVTHEFLGT